MTKTLAALVALTLAFIAHNSKAWTGYHDPDTEGPLATSQPAPATADTAPLGSYEPVMTVEPPVVEVGINLPIPPRPIGLYWVWVPEWRRYEWLPPRHHYWRSHFRRHEPAQLMPHRSLRAHGAHRH